MEGIVFVYISKAISFAGHSFHLQVTPMSIHSQFACLQQLIRCFLFANVNGSISTIKLKHDTTSLVKLTTRISPSLTSILDYFNQRLTLIW